MNKLDTLLRVPLTMEDAELAYHLLKNIAGATEELAALRAENERLKTEILTIRRVLAKKAAARVKQEKGG